MAIDINASFFFLSYDEPFAEEHYALLRTRIPHAHHVRGIKGVHNVVYKAAELSATTKFFVLDADGVLCSDFDFSIPPEVAEYSTIVWKARNTAIGVDYGLGGLKLYDVSDIDRQFGMETVPATLPESRKLFRKEYDGASGTRSLYLDQTANVNCFNKSPLTAWRGAFRETFKLSLEQQRYGRTADGKMRLARWLSPLPNAENADLVLLGARQGIEASKSSLNRWLPVINDFDALRSYFEETVRRTECKVCLI